MTGVGSAVIETDAVRRGGRIEPETNGEQHSATSKRAPAGPTSAPG